MKNESLGTYYNKVLLIEDCPDLREFYLDLFEGEDVALEVWDDIPNIEINVAQEYDVLICDWLVKGQSALNWLLNLERANMLPKTCLVVTGMLDLRDQIGHLPIHILYKPIEFSELKAYLFKIKENQQDRS